VKSVIAELKSRGYVERGWIGVQVQSVTKEIAESLGMPEATGALLSRTEPGGPAAKAGLRAGDVVVSIDGSTVKDSRDLARKIAAVAPNTAVKVGYVREGKAQTLSVTLSQLGDRTALGGREHPQESKRGDQTSKLGIAVAPASRVMGIGAEGLTVVRVDPNGKAAEIGLAPGDIILKVGSRDMQNPQDLVKALDEARGSKRYVLARIKRNDRELFIALPVTAS
jgi:serine protease Do